MRVGVGRGRDGVVESVWTKLANTLIRTDAKRKKLENKEGG